MIRRVDHIAVLIPARNEEALLARCLLSVLASAARLPDETTSDVIVAVDCSVDATLEIARAILGTRGRTIVVDAGSVGVARRHAAQTALRRFRGTSDRCWLANTDADCIVPGEWLLEHLTWAHRGLQAVAGIVDVDDFSEYHPGIEARFRESYRIHTDGTHPHVHGANIGVRGDVYLAAGGWAELETAEDHDLWNRVSQLGCRTHSAARLRVVTSGRQAGRAPEGFAGALVAHNEEFV